MMKRVELYFDGSCDNNSKLKLMGAGVAVFIDNVRFEEHDCLKMLGSNGTNNIAEYGAFAMALEKISELIGKYGTDVYFVVYGDSQLVVNQYRGVWDCNWPHLQELLEECRTLRRSLNIPASRFRLQWISRKFNKEADKLAARAVTEYIESLN